MSVSITGPNLNLSSDPTNAAIDALAYSSQPVLFLQIGANDGITNDPMYKHVTQYHWTGILIEPVPHIFSRLKKTYIEEKQLIFENVAISSFNGQCSFWYVAPNTVLDDKYDHVGSLFRQHLIDHDVRFPGIHRFMKCETVRCSTVQKILDKHSVSKVDILIVDAEGMDGEIILEFNIRGYQPKVVVYEWVHLEPSTRASCAELLEFNNYKLLKHKKNVIAISHLHPLYGCLKV